MSPLCRPTGSGEAERPNLEALFLKSNVTVTYHTDKHPPRQDTGATPFLGAKPAVSTGKCAHTP